MKHLSVKAWSFYQTRGCSSTPIDPSSGYRF